MPIAALFPTTKNSKSRQMCKLGMVCPFNGIVHLQEQEWITNTYNDMDLKSMVAPVMKPDTRKPHFCLIPFLWKPTKDKTWMAEWDQWWIQIMVIMFTFVRTHCTTCLRWVHFNQVGVFKMKGKWSWLIDSSWHPSLVEWGPSDTDPTGALGAGHWFNHYPDLNSSGETVWGPAEHS